MSDDARPVQSLMGDVLAGDQTVVDAREDVGTSSGLAVPDGSRGESRKRRVLTLGETLTVARWLEERREEIEATHPTMHELAEQLAETTGVRVRPKRIRQFCEQLKISYERRPQSDESQQVVGPAAQVDAVDAVEAVEAVEAVIKDLCEASAVLALAIESAMEGIDKSAKAAVPRLTDSIRRLAQLRDLEGGGEHGNGKG